MNVNIRISHFEISRYFAKCDFLTMGHSNGKRLSQLYLELVDAYKIVDAYKKRWLKMDKLPY